MEKALKNKYLKGITFWDVDLDSLDLIKDKNYIISRITERGTDLEVSFIRFFYSKKDILFVVNNTKGLSPKTKNYFNTIEL